MLSMQLYIIISIVLHVHVYFVHIKLYVNVYFLYNTSICLYSLILQGQVKVSAIYNCYGSAYMHNIIVIVMYFCIVLHFHAPFKLVF